LQSRGRGGGRARERRVRDQLHTATTQTTVVAGASRSRYGATGGPNQRRRLGWPGLARGGPGRGHQGDPPATTDRGREARAGRARQRLPAAAAAAHPAQQRTARCLAGRGRGAGHETEDSQKQPQEQQNSPRGESPGGGRMTIMDTHTRAHRAGGRRAAAVKQGTAGQPEARVGGARRHSGAVTDTGGDQTTRRGPRVDRATYGTTTNGLGGKQNGGRADPR